MIRCVAFDFDGVFTDNAVYVLQDGTEMVRCTRADGLGLQQLQRQRSQIVVISTEKNPIVGARCAKLGDRVPAGQCATRCARSNGFLSRWGYRLRKQRFWETTSMILRCSRRSDFPRWWPMRPPGSSARKTSHQQSRRTWRGSGI